jgi:hypothetical protein
MLFILLPASYWLPASAYSATLKKEAVFVSKTSANF